MAWSHGLGSGRTLKDSLEKTLLNSWRWSGIPSAGVRDAVVGWAASLFHLNASASLWEMVKVAWASSRILCSVVMKMRSPSSNSEVASSSSSSSGTRAGGPPLEQQETRLASVFCVFCSARISSQQPEQQLLEQ